MSVEISNASTAVSSGLMQNNLSNLSSNMPAIKNESPVNLSSIVINDQDLASDGIGAYVFIAIISILIIVLLYYAYSKFAFNKYSETFTKGVEQERDDPVIDFNLREAIRGLQNRQQQVLSTLSETFD